MSLFTRAANGDYLNPAERAFLKLLHSFAITGFVAILPTVVQLEQSALSGTVVVDWPRALVLLAVAFVVAFMHAGAKYLTASGDALAGQAVDAVATDISQHAGLPPVAPAADPAPVAVPVAPPVIPIAPAV